MNSDTVLKLEFLKSIAQQVTSDLERDALRTIRQRDPAKGMEILQRIEGIARFLDEVERVCGSGFYKRQLAVTSGENTPPLRPHSQPKTLTTKSKGAKRGSELR